jgi:hypothetical protein
MISIIMSLKNIPTSLESLFLRKPYLRMYFDLEIDPNFELKNAKNINEFYLMHNNRALASQISPKLQAERLIDSQSIQKYQLVVLFGLGNPHLIEILNSKMPEGQLFLVIDKEIGLFSTMLEKFLLPFLEIPGRHLFLGENSISLLFNYLESLPIDKLTGIRFFRNPNDYNTKRDYYQPLEERISKLFSSKMSDLLTKFEFERIWVKNTICNTIQFKNNLVQRFKVKILENILENVPAILVSAGPGLRRQCESIQRIRDKVFILSCDTSYKVLQKFQIIPDGIITLDAQTHSFFHFMGEDFSEIPLFADMVASPQLLRTFQFKSIVHSQTAKYQIDAAGNPFREATAGSSVVDKYIGETGDIQSGGSVATSGFDLLRFLGCKTIFLFGQDLAYTGREIHSTGTHHNEKWIGLLNRKISLEKINEAVVRKRQTKSVPSIDGKEVLTDYVLEVYKNWFEESMLNIDTNVYNVGISGAYIKNMENIDQTKFLKLMEQYPKHEFHWKQLPPWQIDSSFDKSEVQVNLKDIFNNELIDLLNRITTFDKEELDPEKIIDILSNELKEKPYLQSMIRKTEIYLKRHTDLEISKKKDLLLNSLKKEIKFLKRGLYTNG